MLRPWSDRRIEECGEPLLPLQPEFYCLKPHPYQVLGAPYGEGVNPFVLREGVRRRLLAAQQELSHRAPGLRFAIFDAWRPVAVQQFMVEHAFAEECARLGLPRSASAGDAALEQRLKIVRQSVGRFWAPPSADAATPPPHSTGAAVDLTLADPSGHPLDMGGDIDAIGAVSEPAFFREAARSGCDSEAYAFDQRRTLLNAVLAGQGFCRHPNEWWHFSYGDQLWAWSTGHETARYGRLESDR